MSHWRSCVLIHLEWYYFDSMRASHRNSLDWHIYYIIPYDLYRQKKNRWNIIIAWLYTLFLRTKTYKRLLFACTQSGKAQNFALYTLTYKGRYENKYINAWKRVACIMCIWNTILGRFNAPAEARSLNLNRKAIFFSPFFERYTPSRVWT